MISIRRVAVVAGTPAACASFEIVAADMAPDEMNRDVPDWIRIGHRKQRLIGLPQAFEIFYDAQQLMITHAYTL
jgi:hypothetical protein